MQGYFAGFISNEINDMRVHLIEGDEHHSILARRLGYIGKSDAIESGLIAFEWPPYPTCTIDFICADTRNADNIRAIRRFVLKHASKGYEYGQIDITGDIAGSYRFYSSPDEFIEKTYSI
jgi:hypothetical protein